MLHLRFEILVQIFQPIRITKLKLDPIVKSHNPTSFPVVPTLTFATTKAKDITVV